MSVNCFVMQKEEKWKLYLVAYLAETSYFIWFLPLQVFDALQDLVSSMQREADRQTHTSQAEQLNGKIITHTHTHTQWVAL